MGNEPDRAGRSDQSGQDERPPPSSSAGSDQGPDQGSHEAETLASLGEIMGQVARSLQEEHGDVAATLDAITVAAVGAVPGTDECGISLVVERRRVQSRAPTGELPLIIDKLQERLGEGPCLDAVWEHATVRIDDIGSEQRWPRFAEGAQAAGVRSMLSFQLFVTGDTLGALNLYARTAHAFGEESESVGLVFASHASIALAGAQHEERLRIAVSTRDLIGQAKGILMERFRLTSDQAFKVLVGASSHTNRKVRDVAEELCATGALPDDGARRR
jgi:GAF domain-containing protein